MVTEGMVLFRIEDFEECRRRIASHIGRHLIDFVEEEDRILNAGLFHAAQDAAARAKAKSAKKA